MTRVYLDLRMKASEQKRSEAFELTGSKTATLTSEVMTLKEKMENEYISIYNSMDEEKLKIQKTLALLKNDKTTELDKEETQGQERSKKHMLENALSLK